MNLGELFPVLIGLLSGALLAVLRPSMRLWVGACLAVVFGVLATMLSGEFRLSWGFLLIDIPLVALSAVAGMWLTRQFLQRRAAQVKRDK